MSRKEITEEMRNRIKELYDIRKFSMTEIADEVGVSILTVNKITHECYISKPKGRTETQMRTEIIEEHIMDCFDNDINALIETINNIIRDGNVKRACQEVIQGGCLLCYYNDVNEFLKELNCQLSDNDETNWSMYKKLVAKRMEKIYIRNTK